MACSSNVLPPEWADNRTRHSGSHVTRPLLVTHSTAWPGVPSHVCPLLRDGSRDRREESRAIYVNDLSVIHKAPRPRPDWKARWPAGRQGLFIKAGNFFASARVKEGGGHNFDRWTLPSHCRNFFKGGGDRSGPLSQLDCGLFFFFTFYETNLFTAD